MFNFNNVAAYEKWINDFEDSRREDGVFPGIVPTGLWGYHWGNGPAWDSAYLIIPWNLYLYYGDRRVLEEHYEGMKGYVDYLSRQADNHIVSIGLGDWCPARTETPAEVTSTGYYYCDAQIVSKVARLLGKSEDAQRYAELARRIKEAFNRKYYDRQTGLYAGGTQTAMACALYWGLVTEDNKERVLHNLVENIRKNDNHLDVGILGTKYMLSTLTDNGHADVVYAMASKKTFPGWGYWIEQGATTLWEDWPGKASRNHIFFGDLSAWFYKTLAGINYYPDQPGFKHFIIKPHVLGGLTRAEADYDSIRGRISSRWEISTDVFILNVTIPANSTATIFLPGADRQAVTEGDRPAAQADGVQFTGKEAGRLLYSVGSGSYRFKVGS